MPRIGRVAICASRGPSLPSVALLGLIALAGCGSQVHSAAPATASLAGSPAPLAALHGQAGALLSGGFFARLRGLRGFPVVVNKWASWCGPCHSEFPVFQQVSVAYGREVAFLGLDGKDQAPAARAFLRRFPVSYPSYSDPQEAIARAIRAATYYPQTIYFDRRGTVVYDHVGPYVTVAALAQDLRRYGMAPG